MKVDTLSIGILTLVAEHVGPFLKVGVRAPSGAEHGELHMTLGEWTSLKTTLDVLAAADKRHAEDRAQIDVLKQEVRELEQQRDAARTAGEMLRADADRLFNALDVALGLADTPEHLQDEEWCAERKQCGEVCDSYVGFKGPPGEHTAPKEAARG